MSYGISKCGFGNSHWTIYDAFGYVFCNNGRVSASCKSAFTGDVASMAYNMQVAFATTVIGLFSGGIGYILLQVKQRWIDRDLLNLDFLAGLAGRLEEQAGKEEIR